MGTTKDYLDYLNTEVGIAPASSQEELDCAQSLAGIFSSHGLDPQVQEFSVSSLGTLPAGVVMAVLFVGMVLIGLGGTTTLVLGLVLCAAAIALLAMTYGGKDVLRQFGPRAHSQNVVAFHEAEGEDASRNRPIVILAHYDTPRVDLLSRPEIAAVKKMIATAAPYCVIIDTVCAFIQILLFLPAPFRRTLWVVGIIAALPLLAWGVSLIAGRFAPYTSGAVDNKSSVAAMLGVLDHVCPNGSAPETSASSKPADNEPQEVHDSIVTPIPAIEPPKKPAMRREVEKVVGVRHGERVLRDLEILPASCEITYIEPEVRMVPVAEPVPSGDKTAQLPTQTAPAMAVQDDPDATNAMYEPTPSAAGQIPAPDDGNDNGNTPQAVAPDSDSDSDATSSFEPVSEDDGDSETTHALQPLPVRERVEASEPTPGEVAAGVTGALSNAASSVAEFGHSMKNRVFSVAERLGLSERLAHLENGQRTDEGPTVETDHSGITTMADEDAEQAASAERSERPAPSKVDDPEWGKSTYVPHARAARAPQALESEDGAADPAPADAAQIPAVEDDHVPAEETAQQAPVQEAPEEQCAAEESEPTSQLPPEAPAAARRSNVSSVARRAALFDLPDPLSDGTDSLSAPAAPAQRALASESQMAQPRADAGNAFSASPAPVRIDDSDDVSRYSNPYPTSVPESVQADDIQVLDAPVNMQDEALSHTKEKRGLRGLLGKKHREQQESMSEWLGVDEDYNAKDSGENIGSWDHFDDEDRNAPHGGWKGGAARSIELRDGDGPDDADLRDAVLSMDDADLRSHDIWFVATGASELGHAGIRQFVDENKKSLRGAFVFNLECVGAGALTALTREGFGNPRRGDRRLTALLSSVADDLHIGLTKMARPWADTEATPLMRRSLRAVTLIGMGTSELPAFAKTADDVPENVNERQVEDVAALITEVIRRS